MGKPVVVHHPRYESDYPTAAVECPERVAVIREALEPHYPFLIPEPASPADLRRVHSDEVIETLRRADPNLYESARLSAGGALRTAREALDGNPAFGLIRPPGHHASADRHWGFCFFNNMAVALSALLADGLIRRAFVLDFDLHFGDGTDNLFCLDDRVTVFNGIGAKSRWLYLDAVREALEQVRDVDLIGVSAGFDIGEKDWGGLLTAGDFEEMGRMIKGAAGRLCDGRRFALLEGGYFLPELGVNAKAFCRGFL